MVSNVPVTLRVPKSMDDFFENMRHRQIKVKGVSISLDDSKTEIYLRALRFSVHHAEEWLKD